MSIRQSFSFCACWGRWNVQFVNNNEEKTNMKPLQVFQNKCLGLILSTNKFIRINRLHAKANMSMINQYILKLSEKFYQNNLDCNELTKDINKINKYYLP